MVPLLYLGSLKGLKLAGLKVFFLHPSGRVLRKERSLLTNQHHGPFDVSFR
jgi:hypothetical protein